MRINFGLACFVLQLPVSSNLAGGCLLAALAARRSGDSATFCSD
jgi:hypothetical protein